MSNDGYITAENIESSKEHFRLVLKKLKMLDKLGIKWIPYKWHYVGKYDTYEMEILLPDDNVIIETRVTLPKFDDGKVRVHDWRHTALIKLNNKGNWADIAHYSIAMLFETLKARHERGDALYQDYEYRKAHGENYMLLKDYNAWKKKHDVK